MPIYIEAPKDSWQRRAVEKTGGNQTLLGCFVLAILGWQHGRYPPRFGRVARISKEGIIYSNMQDKDGVIRSDHMLGPLQTVVDNFRGLADELKLNDNERKQMFDELRKWFFMDQRVQSAPLK